MKNSCWLRSGDWSQDVIVIKEFTIGSNQEIGANESRPYHFMQLEISIFETNRVILRLTQQRKIIKSHAWQTDYNLETELLKRLDKFLKGAKIDPSRIKKVKFFTKSPSFTTNLIVETMAKSFSFGLSELCQKDALQANPVGSSLPTGAKM